MWLISGALSILRPRRWLDSYLHMSRQFIKHPSQVVSVGDVGDGLKKIDVKREKVNLSLVKHRMNLTDYVRCGISGRFSENHIKQSGMRVCKTFPKDRHLISNPWDFIRRVRTETFGKSSAMSSPLPSLRPRKRLSPQRSASS